MICYLEGVPFSDFPALYRGARVSAYPSKYEGFGIPILESLTSGVPTVGARGSCLEEAGGNGAIYVDPYEPHELSNAVKEILFNEEFARELVENGLRHASKFRVDDVAENVMKVYEKVLGSLMQEMGGRKIY